MEVTVHDLVQVVPEHFWGGCIVTVDETYPWGIIAHLKIPTKGNAYVRLKSDEYVHVGRAEFTSEE